MGIAYTFCVKREPVHTSKLELVTIADVLAAIDD